MCHAQDVNKSVVVKLSTTERVLRRIWKNFVAAPWVKKKGFLFTPSARCLEDEKLKNDFGRCERKSAGSVADDAGGG